MRQRRSEKHTLTHRDAHATVPNCFGSCRWHGYQTTLKQACFQGYPESAVYVQIPIGSRNSAIHNAYHTSLRPSSLLEPRHPSLKVVSSSLHFPLTECKSKFLFAVYREWVEQVCQHLVQPTTHEYLSGHMSDYP